MKAVGIIAEYNPFHNGHAYQIRRAKELSGADYAVVAMSGNFIQRGAPAILDKRLRAAMALSCGADFVFELPTLFATSSAESFATAGVALFDALGCVNSVCFGCETPDPALFASTAGFLSDEPAEYRTLLSSFLKQGMSFPSAREKAVSAHLGADAAAILQSPNNILAIEYQKALLRLNSSIRPLPLQRKGAGYHSTDLSQRCCSATAIRNRLISLEDASVSSDIADALKNYIPKKAADLLFSKDNCFLTEDDFSQILYYKLLCGQEAGFSDYADGSKELSNRICRMLPQFTDFSSFCELLKSREVTYSRLSRMLFHILLELKQSDFNDAKDCGYVPYLRLLGFRKSAAPLLGEISAHTSLPILTRPAKQCASLAGAARRIFQQDVFASNLYYGVLAHKSKTPQKNEYQRGVCVL